MALTFALPFEKARPHLAPVLRLAVLLALSKGLALLASIIIARQFDRQVSGLLFFMTGLVALSLSFTTLGLTASASYHHARNLVRRRFGRIRQTSCLVVGVALPTSAITGLFVLAMPQASGLWVIIAVALACFMAAIRHWARTILAIEGRREWSLVHDGMLFHAVLVLGLLLQRGKTADAALAVLVLSALISGLAAFWHVGRLSGQQATASRRLPPRRYTRRLLAIGLPAMVAQGSGVLLNKIDVVMLGPLATAGAVADYAVAVRMTYVTGALAEIVGLFLTPQLVAAAASRDPARQWRLLRLTMLLQAAATLILAVPMMLLAGDVITLVFGETYRSAVPVFLILQTGRLVTGVFAAALTLFTGLGYSAVLAKTNAAAALVNLLLNAALIPTWGAQGAAVATLVSLLLMGFRSAVIARTLWQQGGGHVA